MPIKLPCGTCSKPVANNHRAILCDLCSLLVHIKCNFTSVEEYNRLIDHNSPWTCHKCISTEAPFQCLRDEELRLSLQGKTIHKPSILEREFQDIQFFNDVECVLENNVELSVTKCPYLSLSELNNLKINKDKAKSFFHIN